MPGLPEFSVIVPFLDCPHLTQRFASSLRATSSHQDYELLLVDTGSSHRTLKSLEGIDNALIVDGSSGSPFSFFGALNRGVQASRGRILVFANNDMEFWSRDLLRAISDALSSHPGVGLVTPRIVVDDSAPAPEADPYVEIVDYHQSSYLVAMPRHVYDEIGGFEEAYHGYGFEEADLAIRLVRHGYRIGVMQRSWCRHDGYSTFKKAGIVPESALLANALVFSKIHGYPLDPHLDLTKDIRLNCHSLAAHAVARELSKHFPGFGMK